ncbi:hypothetical protein [Alkalihalobacterium alkalinitrilicum]|uniref:hypothetical protein n=1 Tax=Alkalihalobacterium alkalinitrilicum TaxID=427920 RepID=UPI001303142F|nr:hypothetical protein [Alkalihalobacterium alkalinitrilicum]
MEGFNIENKKVVQFPRIENELANNKMTFINDNGKWVIKGAQKVAQITWDVA